MWIKTSNEPINSPPTKVQWETLEFIANYIKEKGYAPSIEEMVEHFGRSKSTIWQRVEYLKRKGFLMKWKDKPRGIDLPDEWDRRIEIRQFLDYKSS